MLPKHLVIINERLSYLEKIVIVYLALRSARKGLHMVSNKKIYLSSPAMGGGEMKYIEKAFETNWIAPLGANVDDFEKVLSSYVGSGAALALASGTSAIHLGLKALGVGEGDYVFCSDLTFAASCNPIRYEKATPVFIDCEPESWNMSPVALEKAFEEYTPKAVVVVHLYGQPANIEKIKEICDSHGVPILEDAAESLGATVNGRQTGTFGKVGIYSFNGNKIITTSGGGMLVSDDRALVDKARFWSTQSRDAAPHYQHSELGYNYRLSNVCAGIGLGQMEVLDSRIARKIEIRRVYEEAFQGIDSIQLNPVDVHGQGNHWLTCMTLASDSTASVSDILSSLAEQNIEARPVWKPMSLQPYYEDCPAFSHRDDGECEGWLLFDRGLCLPSDVNMTREDQLLVVDIVKKALS